MRHLLCALAFAILGFDVLGCAWAQDYPNRPLRLIVGYPPGGAGDTVARFIASKYSEQLSQPVVVENKPGATATIAAGIAAKATPDGYTLSFSTSATHATNPALYANIPFDPIKDFTPIGMIGAVPLCVVVISLNRRMN